MKEFYGSIEYKMPAEMAKIILKERKGNDARMDPQKYLCNYVNEQYGLKGNCVNVILY